jgi:hypothetical protein
MYKLILTAIAVFIFSGCSSKTEYTPVICEELQQDPTQILPKECKVYSEKEAQKSYDKIKDEKKISDNDVIEYKKEK